MMAAMPMLTRKAPVAAPPRTEILKELRIQARRRPTLGPAVEQQLILRVSMQG